MSRNRSKASAKRILEVDDHVMLGSPIIDPVHWHPGIVLWTDGMEVLVEQYGIAMATPHKALHGCDYVRAFGSREHCAAEKRKAQAVVRDAARQCEELEQLAGDLRRKLMDVFAIVATKAVEASAEALPSDLRTPGAAKAPRKRRAMICDHHPEPT